MPLCALRAATGTAGTGGGSCFAKEPGVAPGRAAARVARMEGCAFGCLKAKGGSTRRINTVDSAGNRVHYFKFFGSRGSVGTALCRTYICDCWSEQAAGLEKCNGIRAWSGYKADAACAKKTRDGHTCPKPASTTAATTIAATATTTRAVVLSTVEVRVGLPGTDYITFSQQSGGVIDLRGAWPFRATLSAVLSAV